MADPTSTLAAHADGDSDATQRLLPLVYAELRNLAGHYMQQERSDHLLQPTALVHEAYLRRIDVTRIDWQGKTHFFAMAATQMRRVLVEYARARDREKRGSDRLQVTLDESLALVDGLSFEMLALDQALERLAKRHARQGRVAELRIVSGMTVREIATVLEVSERTVNEDWKIGRAWLGRWLRSEAGRTS